MRTISLEAAPNLLELAFQAKCGEEIILTQADTPIARIVPMPETLQPRQPGTAKGIILHIAEDFDETPEGFDIVSSERPV
jgi:antitoxin (DNA-binding transcriptional repressor) of toxin-antitoxin stability system